jgi:hypothetical protein
VCSQKYIKRELWDDSNPNHIVSSLEFPTGATNVALANWDAGAWIWDNGACNYAFNSQEIISSWANPEDGHSYVLGTGSGHGTVSIREWSHIYKDIPGPYNTSVEVSTISNLQEFVDGIGQDIAGLNGVGEGGMNDGRTFLPLFLKPTSMGGQWNGQSTTPAPGTNYYEYAHPRPLSSGGSYDGSLLPYAYDWTFHDWT